jgi:RimJ/RimL family protein N-acetyltransferase
VIDRFETERLALRPVTHDDIDPLMTLDSDPEVMRYINGGRASTRAEVAETVRESLGHRWMAFERSTGELVGWLSLALPVDAPDERELGYRLRRAMWKRGFAVEGSRALVDLAFNDLGVRRVWAQTMTVNAASRRVMERCGLRYVRTFHLDWPEPIAGSELGDVEYELRKPDWESG